MKLRSPRELAFRASQRLASALDQALPPPKFQGVFRGLSMADGRASAAAAADTDFARGVIQLARGFHRGEFPIFGEVLETDGAIDWRRDYHHGISTRIAPFRSIPFLDFARCGDHKYIWEINRHQHLVVLAQAWLITGDRSHVELIQSHIRSWAEQNPYLRSINWASALELAFRSLSWLWVWHLAGDALSTSVRALLGDLLTQQATAISHNLSTYFAPNTHILGEAVALHATGAALGNERWRREGSQLVNREVAAQILPDGMHFELSAYYHLYALDMLMFHYAMVGDERLRPVLVRMAEVLDRLTDQGGEMPLIGDDDGGRFFFPYGTRTRFGNATLATCAALFPEARIRSNPDDFPEQGLWWIGKRRDIKSKRTERSVIHLPDSGLSIFRREHFQLVFDCGPLSRGGAGHSHADCLSVVLVSRGQTILCDPGTFTYVADIAERDRFRGTAAHSTVCLGRRDQADPVKPFRWDNKPAVRRLEAGPWRASAECVYRGYRHERSVSISDTSEIEVRDAVSGPGGPVEQVWHSPLEIHQESDRVFRIGAVQIQIDAILTPRIEPGWRSDVFGKRDRSFRLVCSTENVPTLPIVTRIVADAR